MLKHDWVAADGPQVGWADERGRLFVVGVAICASAVFVAWLGLGVGGERSVLFVDALGTTFAALAATALCLRAGGRQVGRMRRFWWLLAAACGAWALGEAIWAVYDLVLSRPVPVPSWADVGYLSAVPLAAAALLSHPAMLRSRARRARALFDGLLVATALLFLSWTFVLGPLWQNADLSGIGGLVALAYPFGDAIIVFVVVLVMRGVSGEGRLALWCLLAGLFAIALADSTYAYLTEVRSYESGDLLDSGWFVGYLAIAVGAYCADGRTVVSGAAESPSASLAPILAPFLPMLLALTVISVEVQLGHRPDTVAMILALALVALALARQALLVADLIGPSGEHEGKVSARLRGVLLDAFGGGAGIESPPATPRDRSAP